MPTPSFLHPFTAPRATKFLNIVGGQGAVVWDDTGKRYIDAMASLWYMNVGHGHPAMLDAITRQGKDLAAYHAFPPFTNPAADRAADRIAALSPMDGSRVFLADSGSEAVDSAMKLARIAHREAGESDRQIIISRQHGYHGTNFGGTSAQGIPANRDGFGPLVGDVINVPAGNVEAMAQVFDQHAGRIAAVLTEPVQGAGGVFPPPSGYLASLRRLCDAEGAFLIMDEVITGFGRLGKWFGSEFFEVRPDLITFAKAVTSGYVPLGGVIAGPAVVAALEANEGFILKHGYTYSGHPLASAAAVAAIEITEAEGLLERASAIGARLEHGLRSLADDGLVTEARGVGAVWAVGLADHIDPASIRDALLQSGVIMRPLAASLAMCPPLVITESEIDHILDSLVAVLAGSD